jgi:hypothetical protein
MARRHRIARRMRHVALHPITRQSARALTPIPSPWPAPRSSASGPPSWPAVRRRRRHRGARPGPWGYQAWVSYTGHENPIEVPYSA